MNFVPVTYFVRENALKKIARPHNGKYISLTNAQKVGFVFDAAIPDSERAVTYLCHVLRRGNKDFHGIVIDSRKKKEKESALFPDNIKEITIITREDMNWFGQPVSEYIDTLASVHYDIFIDLSAPKRRFALDYILQSIDCRLKIGTDYCKSDDYDLKITATKNEENPDEIISGYVLVKNILDYLTIIK